MGYVLIAEIVAYVLFCENELSHHLNADALQDSRVVFQVSRRLLRPKLISLYLY